MPAATSKRKPDAVKDAIHSHDIAALHTAIQSDPQRARHPSYMSAAAGLAFLDGIKALHKNGSDLNAITRNYRPLHNLLQSHVHEPEKDKPTPTRLECLKWLLAHGADPELMAAWPQARAIIVAAFMGFDDYIDILKKAGARIDGFASAALGDLEGVRKALAADAGFVHARDGGVLTPLQCCCGSRMKSPAALEIATLLIDGGASVTAETKSYAHSVDAVYFAASAKNAELFSLLLDRGADPTRALVPALWNGNFALGEIALDHGADPDRAIADQAKPLLNHLICWGQIPPTLWLLERGASPNVPDPQGWTAVHQAASRGNFRMMEAVLNAGGDIAKRDKQGQTPLAVAITAGRGQLVQLMRLTR
jgi:ankyrin repeat protein